MNITRSSVLGQIASKGKDGWIFRSTIARWLGISVRTVQRAITQARTLGLLIVVRGRKDEVPPRAKNDPNKEPIPCGWSHRFTVGWGKAGAALKQAITRARLAWITRQLRRDGKRPSAEAAREVQAQTARAGPRTAEELDAELALLPRGV